MMQQYHIPLLLFLLICALLVPTPATHAQPISPAPSEPTSIVVNYATLISPEDQQDSQPSLEVFFTVMDAQWQPIMQPDIATAHFLFDQQDDIEAIVGDPETPPYIALLLDASGSMASNMQEVRQAARNAIREAPPDTSFMVYRFSHERTPMLAADAIFSTEARQIEDAILKIEAIPEGVTCLYDSIYDTIKDLKREVPDQQARRAVIAFTDGVDELRDGQPCSKRTLSEVVEEAQSIADRDANPVPVYTIGLCTADTNDPCTQSESFEFQDEPITDNPLKFLAAYTNGLSAMGELGDINTSFKQIMQGLNSQWLAQADVFTSRGRNRAVLEVTFADGTTLQSSEFEFTSAAEYTLLPMVSIVRAQYVDDQYIVELDLTNPAAIGEVTVGIREEKGTELPEQIITQEEIQSKIANPLTVAINTSNFQTDHTYCFVIRAENSKGQPIHNPQGLNAQDNNLDEECVVYYPQINFSINTVSPNIRQGKLLINLSIDEALEQQFIYEVSIIDEQTNQPVNDASLPQGLLNGEQIEMAIPEKIQQTDEERAYIVHVTLKKAGTEQGTLATYNVRFRPPGFFGRMFMIIGNPFVLGFILLVFAGTIGWIAYTKQPTRKGAPPEPLIYDKTVIKPVFKHKPVQMKLGIRVLRTPDTAQKREVVIEYTEIAPGQMEFMTRTKMPATAQKQDMPATFTHKPLVIGRATTADLQITGDKQISREHVQIRVEGTTFILTDLNSQNGTFINDKRLAEEFRLVNKTVVDLGPHTRLEIEPASS